MTKALLFTFLQSNLDASCRLAAAVAPAFFKAHGE
jgi:hypothetical protein